MLPLPLVLTAAALLAAGDPGPCRALAVGPVGSATEDLARLAELTGAAPLTSQLFRRWSDRAEVLLCDPGTTPEARREAAVAAAPAPGALAVDLLPATWRTYLESAYPDDRNDGALWRGRGLSTELTAGARLRWRFFSAALAPVAAWQQNRDFAHPASTRAGFSPYANPYNDGSIDLPLRFGPTDFWTFDPGQSFARVDLFHVALGFSTENLWWGPGTRNSLLMTNSGPGVPHVFLGTSGPQDIGIGQLEAQLVWGRLRESRWFDADSSNDRTLFTALTVGYAPSFIPGLSVGLARVYLYRIPPSGVPFKKYFLPLFGPVLKDQVPGGDDPDDQLLSLMARWAFPQVGLELYGEWGRDDHSNDLKDLVTEPEHSQAFTLGLQKVSPLGRRWLRFTAELAHTLEKPPSNPTRPVPIFYTHWYETQGYTHRGQMLGAGIGPQADSQFIALDVIGQRGSAGLWVERVLRNDRWFYDQVHVWKGEDAELAGGVRGRLSTRELDLEGSLGLAERYNANFIADVSSVKAMLDVTWWPGRRAAPGLPPPTLTP